MEAVISDTELKIIDLFVNTSKALGLPKSIGEIYGLVYCTDQPISMESIMEKLSMSSGSTSQGLKTLRSLGAVKTVYVPGERKDHYIAELDFRKVITQYISDVLLPQFSTSSSKLEEISKLIESESERPFLAERIKILGKLSKRANMVLPAVTKVLKI